MDNNSNISPKWTSYRKLWIVVAVIIFLILLILLLAGRTPWCEECQPKPKTVEVDKLVDNPEHLARIAVLEKENALIADLKKDNDQIAGLKTNIADLTKSAGLVAGLQAKVKALEGVDLNFDSPKLTSKINLLETENATIGDLKKRIVELEASNAESNDAKNSELTEQIAALKAENGLIAGLKAKVQALEAVDVNFVKPEDNTELVQKINNLEVQTMKIPTLQSRIETLQAENGMIPGLKAKVAALEAVDINFTKSEDNTELVQKINNLEIQTLKIPTLQSRIETLQAENGMIPGLKAKVAALEAVDVNFTKSEDNTELVQKINNLEVQNLKIPTLESRIETLQTENGLIPGLKAKVKALEAIDINFITESSEPPKAPAMALPNVAKLFFESGSSRFPTDVRQSMADVIVYLRAKPSSTVTLAGYHDAAGNINWNRRLAAKRSNRVKQILLDAGVEGNRIKVQRPSQTLGSGLPEEARRVEVKVSN